MINIRSHSKKKRIIFQKINQEKFSEFLNENEAKFNKKKIEEIYVELNKISDNEEDGWEKIEIKKKNNEYKAVKGISK